MLRKLLKYEIEATGRIFLPMYALLIVFALINKFFISVNADYLNIPRIIAMTVFVFIIVGICVMTLVVTIQRFNKNLLCDEGYLSFTLPVKVHTHIDCKMLVSLMWTILSGIVASISIFVLAINKDTIIEFQKFVSEFVLEFNKLGVSGYAIVLEGIIFVILGILCGAVKIYAAISIGNMSSKHRLLVGLGAYLAFGVVGQTITSVIISAFGKSFENYFRSISDTNAPVVMQIMLILMIIYSLVFGVVYYFLTNWMLKKKLNLE